LYFLAIQFQKLLELYTPLLLGENTQFESEGVSAAIVNDARGKNQEQINHRTQRYTETSLNWSLILKYTSAWKFFSLIVLCDTVTHMDRLI
jgi:hypothetical protein